MKVIAPCGARRGLAGFTLVEILVSITLLSLVMLGLAGAMRGMAQSQERVDARLERVDDFRIATGFLYSVVGRLSARRNPALQQLGDSPYYFAGAPGSLMWLGVMPPRFGLGGRHFMRLAIEPSSRGGALVLRFAPWHGAAAFPEWASAHAQVVADGVQTLALQYEDGGVTPPQWLPQWNVPTRLPTRVLLQISTAEGAWPDLIVPLRQFANRSSGEAVIGGTTE